MPQDREIVLNELKLGLMGKILFASIAAWLAGKVIGNIKIKGTEEQVNAVHNAMLSSKRFQDEISRPGATLDSVTNKLGLKHASASEFERILGVPWPL
jgi:hypothetical protein